MNRSQRRQAKKLTPAQRSELMRRKFVLMYDYADIRKDSIIKHHLKRWAPFVVEKFQIEGIAKAHAELNEYFELLTKDLFAYAEEMRNQEAQETQEASSETEDLHASPEAAEESSEAQ